ADGLRSRRIGRPERGKDCAPLDADVSNRIAQRTSGFLYNLANQYLDRCRVGLPDISTRNESVGFPLLDGPRQRLASGELRREPSFFEECDHISAFPSAGREG